MMVALNLFPGGVLQIRDVFEHGYWHARGIAYTGSETARLVECLRLPGDLIFILLGTLPLALAMVLGYRGIRLQPPTPRELSRASNA
jgi:nitric oxide reductase subunit B